MTENIEEKNRHSLIFLGSSGAFQIPSFHCDCDTCQGARNNPQLRRTRASIALIGKEITLVDLSPDLEFQLEREHIRVVDNIFITHWHWNHVAGLGSFGEAASTKKWKPVNLYLPHQTINHFDDELSYLKRTFNIHPILPGDVIRLDDAVWTAVKTTHTDHSVGFIIENVKRLAYLVDGVVSPTETAQQLKNLDLIVLESTIDELTLRKGEKWLNFSFREAVDFWRQIGSRECILTHLSCHSWDKGTLLPGFTPLRRQELEKEYVGLIFAYDGMKLWV